MKYDRMWERLIEYVDEWAGVREVPSGIAITFEYSPGVRRTVEVVMTPAQWDDYISSVYGSGDPRATPFKEKVLAAPEGLPYLVYDTYDWEPSISPELPSDEFDPGKGSWVVRDDAGSVVGRLADWDQPD